MKSKVQWLSIELLGDKYIATVQRESTFKTYKISRSKAIDLYYGFKFSHSKYNLKIGMFAHYYIERKNK